MSGNSSSQSPLASINVTPLTDVLLVLLITFLLTATSFQATAPSVPLPRLASAGEIAERATQISVSLEGQVSWPEGAGPGTEEAFRRLRSSAEHPILALAVHRDLAYSALYPLLAAARAAGWTQIVLLTEEDH